ncbi:hypothetical protein UFOVP116_350 [uncultured Caudovirales phage]|uniref:Uncharacterized protein n=1 Tax=uncultured Caudovirales phage TaxID=2100421 RepID=A0A6J5L771_9CAUD|nr:hypothetical protein UFOVP116_350 [uncultured Caudovirales phage]
MAYFTQDMKKAIAPKVKALCAKYGVKGSMSVKHHSQVCLTIKSGKIDFFKDVSNDSYSKARGYVQVNHYHIDKHFSGKAAEFLNEAKRILNSGNYDNSDIQSDYFDVGFYVSMNIGKWDQPYVLAA